MRKYYLDFLYLFFLELFASYLFFEATLNSLHIIDISLPMTIYVGIGLAVGITMNRVRLKIKKNKVDARLFTFFTIIMIGILYLFLFNYYHYDFLHEKYAWYFCLNIIPIILFETIYHFFSYEELKEEQDSYWFNIFKTANKSDDPEQDRTNKENKK